MKYSTNLFGQTDLYRHDREFALEIFCNSVKKKKLN